MSRGNTAGVESLRSSNARGRVINAENFPGTGRRREPTDRFPSATTHVENHKLRADGNVTKAPSGHRGVLQIHQPDNNPARPTPRLSALARQQNDCADRKPNRSDALKDSSCRVGIHPIILGTLAFACSPAMSHREPDKKLSCCRSHSSWAGVSGTWTPRALDTVSIASFNPVPAAIASDTASNPDLPTLCRQCTAMHFPSRSTRAKSAAACTNLAESLGVPRSGTGIDKNSIPYALQEADSRSSPSSCVSSVSSSDTNTFTP